LPADADSALARATAFQRTALPPEAADSAAKKESSGGVFGRSMLNSLAPGATQQPPPVAPSAPASYETPPGAVPPPTAQTNALVVVEIGAGPAKYGAGKYNSSLKYQEVIPLTFTVSGGGVTAGVAENLFFQANTRGGRQVDSITGGKANWKQGTAIAGEALIAGGKVYGLNSAIGGGIAAAGIITGLVSSQMKAAADMRVWDNLPHDLYLLNLALPADAATVSVTGRNAAGVGTFTAEVPLRAVSASGKTFKIGFVRVDEKSSATEVTPVAVTTPGNGSGARAKVAAVGDLNPTPKPVVAPIADSVVAAAPKPVVVPVTDSSVNLAPKPAASPAVISSVNRFGLPNGTYRNVHLGTLTISGETAHFTSPDGTVSDGKIFQQDERLCLNSGAGEDRKIISYQNGNLLIYSRAADLNPSAIYKFASAN
jgi:hypothetical protein